MFYAIFSILLLATSDENAKRRVHGFSAAAAVEVAEHSRGRNRP